MCLEDVRLGRGTGPSQGGVAVGVADVLVLTAAPRRVLARFSNLGATNIFLAFDRAATLTSGLKVPPNQVPVVIQVTDLDRAVMSEIHAISDVAGGALGFWISELNES